MNQEALNIKETIVSPGTILDRGRGIFEIIGNSYMSNPLGYYTLIMEWLAVYVKDPLPETKFVFNLEYANSTTKKLLYDVIGLLSQISRQNKKLEIEWYYSDDDEDMIDTGKQFEKSSKLNFVFIKK